MTKLDDALNELYWYTCSCGKRYYDKKEREAFPEGGNVGYCDECMEADDNLPCNLKADAEYRDWLDHKDD